MNKPKCSWCKGEHRSTNCYKHCPRCNDPHEKCGCIEYFISEKEGKIATYPGGVSLWYEHRIIRNYPEWRVVLQVEQVTKGIHVEEATKALMSRRDGLIKWQDMWGQVLPSYFL